MPDVSKSLGPFLLGVIVNAILYGIFVLQSFIYLQTYKRDAKWLRCFVLYLFILETLNMAFNIGLVYEPLILNFGEAKALTISPRMLIPHPFLAALITISVQLFIAWRIKAISKSLVVPVLICILAVCAMAGGMGMTIFVARSTGGMPGNPGSSKRFQVFIVLINLWMISSSVADLLIAFTLTIGLLKRESKGRDTTDRASKIIRFTIHTGLFTAILAITNLFVALLANRTAFNFIWDLALSNFYTNALMSTLNARERSRRPPPLALTVPLSTPSIIGTKTPVTITQNPSLRSAEEGSRPYQSQYYNVLFGDDSQWDGSRNSLFEVNSITTLSVPPDYDTAVSSEYISGGSATSSSTASPSEMTRTSAITGSIALAPFSLVSGPSVNSASASIHSAPIGSASDAVTNTGYRNEKYRPMGPRDRS